MDAPDDGARAAMGAIYHCRRHPSRGASASRIVSLAVDFVGAVMGEVGRLEDVELPDRHFDYRSCTAPRIMFILLCRRPQQTGSFVASVHKTCRPVLIACDHLQQSELSPLKPSPIRLSMFQLVPYCFSQFERVQNHRRLPGPSQSARTHSLVLPPGLRV